MVSLCLRQGIVVCVGVSLPKDFYDCTYVAFVMTRVKQCAGRQPFIVPSTECLLTDSACAVLFRSEHADAAPGITRRTGAGRMKLGCILYVCVFGYSSFVWEAQMSGMVRRTLTIRTSSRVL